jgi:hypothetical protein
MPRITGEKPISQVVQLLPDIRPYEYHTLEDALGGHD